MRSISHTNGEREHHDGERNAGGVLYVTIASATGRYAVQSAVLRGGPPMRYLLMTLLMTCAGCGMVTEPEITYDYGDSREANMVLCWDGDYAGLGQPFAPPTASFHADGYCTTTTSFDVCGWSCLGIMTCHNTWCWNCTGHNGQGECVAGVWTFLKQDCEECI